MRPYLRWLLEADLPARHVCVCVCVCINGYIQTNTHTHCDPLSLRPCTLNVFGTAAALAGSNSVPRRAGGPLNAAGVNYRMPDEAQGLSI